MNQFGNRVTAWLVFFCLVLACTWVLPTVAAAQASTGSTAAQAAPAKPATGATTAAPAKSTAGMPSSADIAAAKASGKVWVNTETGVYHKSGRWYGKTKQGKFMTEAEAKAAGYKAAK